MGSHSHAEKDRNKFLLSQDAQYKRRKYTGATAEKIIRDSKNTYCFPRIVEFHFEYTDSIVGTRRSSGLPQMLFC